MILKNAPPRIALLQMLTERTGSVSRWELLITLKNMWTDDKEGEPLEFRFLGRCLSDLNSSKYIRRTKKHSDYSKQKDLFVITKRDFLYCLVKLRTTK